MYTKEKLLEMLSSKKALVRYEACEWIRVRQDSSSEIVTALEKATHDTDKEVAERAKLALQADVHHQMAIKMRVIEPDEIEEVNRSAPSPERERRQSGNVIIWILTSSIFLNLGFLIGQIFFYLPLRHTFALEMESLYCPLSLIPGAALGSLAYYGYRKSKNVAFVFGILLLLGIFVLAIFMGMVGEG